MPSIGGRLRSKGNLDAKVSCDVRSYPISCANRTPTVWTKYDSQPRFGVKDTMYDEVSPGYWEALRRGEFVQTNELHSNRITRESYGWTSIRQTAQTPYVCSPPQFEKPWAEYNGKFVATFHWSSFSGGTLLESDRTVSLLRKVRTECMANRQKGESNFIETLGELDQSWATLNSPLGNLNDYVDDFMSSRRYKEIQRRRKDLGLSNRDIPRRWKSDFLLLLANEWNRFRYGIRPIFSDIKAAMKVVSETYDIGPKIHTARASEQIWATNIVDSYVADAYTRVDYKTTQSHTYKVRAWWHDRYQSTPFDKLGLTLQNVVGGLWEFTRYSYMYDWVVNVGDLIYANLPRVDVDSLGGGYSERTDIHQVFFPVSYTNLVPTSYIVTGTIADGLKESKSYVDRYPMSGQSFLVFKEFDLENWERAVDLISTIKQKMGKIRF